MRNIKSLRVPLPRHIMDIYNYSNYKYGTPYLLHTLNDHYSRTYYVYIIISYEGKIVVWKCDASATCSSPLWVGEGWPSWDLVLNVASCIQVSLLILHLVPCCILGISPLPLYKRLEHTIPWVDRKLATGENEVGLVPELSNAVNLPGDPCTHLQSAPMLARVRNTVHYHINQAGALTPFVATPLCSSRFHFACRIKRARIRNPPSLLGALL